MSLHCRIRKYCELCNRYVFSDSKYCGSCGKLLINHRLYFICWFENTRIQPLGKSPDLLQPKNKDSKSPEKGQNLLITTFKRGSPYEKILKIVT